MRALVLAFLASLAPHFEAYEPPAARVYDLQISPQFTPSQVSEIAQAARDWTDRIPTLRLRVGVGACAAADAPDVHANARICLSPATHDALVEETGVSGILGLTYREGGVEQVQIDETGEEMASSAALRRQVIAHELGHAMGLRHLHTPGTLMYPTVSPHDPVIVMAPGPTSVDVSAWYRVRR